MLILFTSYLFMKFDYYIENIELHGLVIPMSFDGDVSAIAWTKQKSFNCGCPMLLSVLSGDDIVPVGIATPGQGYFKKL